MKSQAANLDDETLRIYRLKGAKLKKYIYIYIKEYDKL